MNSRVIRLKPWEENGSEHIAIDFRFDVGIIEVLTDLGARVSPISGYWLYPAAVGNVATLFNRLRYFGAVFNCGVKPFNKDQVAKNLSKPKALSFNEVCKMLQACRNVKQRCLLTIMYSSGLRAAEVVSLRLNDLNFNRGTITIRAARGRSTREAVLANTASPIVQTYLNSYRPTEWLFEGAVNGHQSIQGAKLIIKQALIRAGIYKACTGQTLRNSLITHLLLQNVDPYTVESILYGSVNHKSSRELVQNTG